MLFVETYDNDNYEMMDKERIVKVDISKQLKMVELTNIQKNISKFKDQVNSILAKQQKENQVSDSILGKRPVQANLEELK